LQFINDNAKENILHDVDFSHSNIPLYELDLDIQIKKVHMLHDDNIEDGMSNDETEIYSFSEFLENESAKTISSNNQESTQIQLITTDDSTNEEISMSFTVKTIKVNWEKCTDA
jgi:hypothetical protein